MSLNVQRKDEVSSVGRGGQRRGEVTSPLRKSVPVTGIILAGGKSRRMGQNKALLQLGDSPLIAHVIRRMRLVTDELLLITNNHTEYAHLGLPMHSDRVPDAGALGGIYTGLTHALYDAVLCVACDSPFLQPKLLTHLVSVLDEYDAAMPYTYKAPSSDNKDAPMTLQTLCAAYSKRCLPIIEQMLNEPDLRVHALQERANILTLAPEIWETYDSEGYSFFNVNTPEDFEKAQTLL